MKQKAFLVLFTSAVMLAGGDGLRPRGNVSDYPAHASVAGVAIGASVVPPDQVRKLFATDLNRAGYIVIEVAVYPSTEKGVDVTAGDFMMRTDADTTVRAATPDAIAGMVEDAKNPPPASSGGGRDITLYPTADIGYESGVDPITGRRVSGVYRGAGVGVGVGGNQGGAPPPPSGVSGRDRETMERELSDKALPEGTATRPVAGYLYFPRPAKKKSGPVELTWYAPSGTVKVPLPPAK